MGGLTKFSPDEGSPVPPKKTRLPAKKVEKIKYFSTLLGLNFIEITRGPLNLFKVIFSLKTMLNKIVYFFNTDP